jgi:hypothetical protein
MCQRRLSGNICMCMERFAHRTELPVISFCPQWTLCAWRCSCKSFPSALRMIYCSLPVMELPAIPQENSACLIISCWHNCHRKALILTPLKTIGTICAKNSSTTFSSTPCKPSKTNSSPPATSITKTPISSIPSQLGTGLLILDRMLIGITPFSPRT